MVPTILQIDIRIKMRYKNYTEMHLTKCDARMNIKISRSKTTYMYWCTYVRVRGLTFGLLVSLHETNIRCDYSITFSVI